MNWDPFERDIMFMHYTDTDITNTSHLIKWKNRQKKKEIRRALANCLLFYCHEGHSHWIRSMCFIITSQPTKFWYEFWNFSFSNITKQTKAK